MKYKYQLYSIQQYYPNGGYQDIVLLSNDFKEILDYLNNLNVWYLENNDIYAIDLINNELIQFVYYNNKLDYNYYDLDILLNDLIKE